MTESRPASLASLAVLGLALVKELSGEAQLERVRQASAREIVQGADEKRAIDAKTGTPLIDQQLYLEVTDQRFRGVRRCC